MLVRDIELATPIPGILLVTSWYQKQLVRLQFSVGDAMSCHSPEMDDDALVLKQVLSDYFLDSSQHPFFTVSLSQLSEFQSRLLEHLQTIPPGQTQTYGQVAALLGSSPRAVGRACATNPFPILYPCHRVVAKSGVGGFIGQAVGAGVDIKRWLLLHEGIDGG